MQHVHRGSQSVLVIDTDQMTGPRVLATLHHAGYQVHLTTNGQDALRRFTAPCQPLPALVLLDVALPDIPGGEVVQALTSMPWAGDIPIVIWGTPALATPPDHALGVRRYLSKRTTDGNLLRLVAAYLRPGSVVADPARRSSGAPLRTGTLQPRP